ncbi:MAG: LCP family protein [Bacillota bacterium]
MSKRKKIISALYITIAVLVVAACGLGVISYLKAKAAWDNPGGTLQAGADAYGYKESVVNLVLIGTDSNPTRKARHEGVHTDTIVICAIDMEKNTARCITIPRDTYANVNKINSNYEIIGEGVDRINTAYMLGVHGNKGNDYQNTLDALSDLFGNQKIPFKYYAAIDMNGIVPIANAVDGLPVTLDVTISGVGQKGETVWLKDQSAEKYIRERKSITGGSDLARAQRQQAFFLGLAKRIKEMGPMDAIPRLWGSLQQYFTTNMSLEDMLAFGSILNKMNTDDIEFAPIPVGTTGWLENKDMFFPDEEELQELALDTWFNLPPGTVLWTASPRRTPSKIIATPTYSSYTMPPTAKATPTATSNKTATQTPKSTIKTTVKPTLKPTTTPKPTATPESSPKPTTTVAHSATPQVTSP